MQYTTQHQWTETRPRPNVVHNTRPGLVDAPRAPIKAAIARRLVRHAVADLPLRVHSRRHVDRCRRFHKYIFPDGIIPSVNALEEAMQTHTSLTVTNRLDFGSHYATTLRCWRERLLANWPLMSAPRFDHVFKRMWEFYLAYCEAGFCASDLNVSQFALNR